MMVSVKMFRDYWNYTDLFQSPTGHWVVRFVYQGGSAAWMFSPSDQEAAKGFCWKQSQHLRSLLPN